MSNLLRLAIVDPNDSQRESLKSMFLGMDTIWFEAECSSYEFFADVVAQTNPDIGLVAIDADPQNSVGLVDLDLCLGDADVFLDSSSDYTLVDVAQNVTRLDFTLLKRSLMKHSSALHLLPRPVQLGDIPLITPDDLQRVIGLLKATFTHLVLDLSKGYTAIDLIALKMANHILLATQIDLSCLRNVVRLMMWFGNMDGLADKVKIVVNRVGLENGQITLKKAEETIGKKIYWHLPNDYRTMIEARNNGVPLIDSAPRAAIAQSLIALAKALSGNGTAPAADAGVKKGFGRLFKLWPNKDLSQSLTSRWSNSLRQIMPSLRRLPPLGRAH